MPSIPFFFFSAGNKCRLSGIMGRGRGRYNNIATTVVTVNGAFSFLKNRRLGSRCCQSQPTRKIRCCFFIFFLASQSAASSHQCLFPFSAFAGQIALLGNGLRRAMTTASRLGVVITAAKATAPHSTHPFLRTPFFPVLVRKRIGRHGKTETC